MVALWEATIDYLRGLPHAAAATRIDAARIRYVLFELYVLGERPSAKEIRIRGGASSRPTEWSRKVAEHWQERLRKPTRGIRDRYSWGQPFSVPQTVIEQHELTPGIEDRLASQVAVTGRKLAEAIGRSADPDEIAQLEAELSITTAALRLYGQWSVFARDHADDDLVWWFDFPGRRNTSFVRVPGT